MTLDNAALPQVSVVVPVFNEQDNIAPLVHEITAALRGVLPFEIIYVDDCSKDDSREILKQLRMTVPELRVFGHTRQSGQSTAIRNGVKQARGEWIATLDGDGQNDPADIPKLLAAWRDGGGESRRLMVTGHRVNRRDTWSKRRASRAANAIRRALLGDDNPDTGCSLKLYERALFLLLPYFDHMHRFLPALARRENCAVAVVPVNHRHRRHGTSKYSNLGRALVGIPDLLGVIWLMRRPPPAHEPKEL